MIFLEYVIFAHVTKTNRGFSRLMHDGYSYGVHSKKSKGHISWICTKVDSTGKKRCTGIVTTKIVNGYEMLSNKTPKHICKLQNKMSC